MAKSLPPKAELEFLRESVTELFGPEFQTWETGVQTPVTLGAVPPKENYLGI